MVESGSVFAADQGRTFSIAGGTMSLEAPEGWKRVEPKSGIVETEFSILPAEGDAQPGRMTVMGAGEAWLKIWIVGTVNLRSPMDHPQKKKRLQKRSSSQVVP